MATFTKRIQQRNWSCKLVYFSFSKQKKSGDILLCRDQQKTAKKQPKNTTKNTMGHISVPWALPASCPPSPGRKLQENNPKTQQKNATGKYAFELFCYSIVRTDGISNTTCMPSVIHCISHFYFEICSLRWHACANAACLLIVSPYTSYYL